MRIGLFGGTFDPAHSAHRAACLLAMKRIGLDRVWWLVTPGNPLKDTSGLAPLASAHAGRARACASSAHRCHRPRSAARHPIHLSDRQLSGPGLPAGAFRLDNGGRQSACLPSLAALARNRRSGTDCRRRSPRAEPVRRGQRRRPGARVFPNSGIGGEEFAGTEAASLDLSARPQVAAILDGAARRAGIAATLDS